MESPSIPGISAYHCQQAAEKALKGFLVWNDKPFRKTHDLRELLRQCQATNATFDWFAEAANALTPFAIVTRYPETGPLITDADAEQSIDVAEEIYQFVLDRLPASVHP